MAVNSGKSPRIRLVGSRIYDSVNGKTCHQCRQKTRDFSAACKNHKIIKPCTIMYCHKCLLNRYGEKAEEVDGLGEWSCPKCRGICNGSVCMKKRGHQPTGILINMAKATGFSSVSEMLQHFQASLPNKRGKENSVTANKSKKVYKRKLEKEAIAEMHNCNKKKRGAEGTDIDKSNKMKRGGII
ncbi:cell division cycle-associated 7-like protein [Salvia splendens]|uniref:cell division cycle-associated 7-like protein n=1 Tax=Salvia splendens TaxID=180675 RepID=UPI001C26F6A1|nr:cell division cycle-associated 7-like protein [Salvia splendens]